MTQTEQKNGRTKTSYLEPHECAEKAREFLAGAKGAGEIAGRAITLIALAVHADEEALAASNRSYHEVSFRGPWAEQAQQDLAELIAERIKPGRAARARSAARQKPGRDRPTEASDDAPQVVGEQTVSEAARPGRVKARLRSPSAIPDGTGLDPTRPARSRAGRAHPRPTEAHMSNTTVKPATAKQLRYLRALAQKTGTTFTPPATSREASREITRMRSLTPTRRHAERS